MDTRLLETFVSVSRTGGFTASAAELHLAQSTVTTQVKTLERELGTRLFDRLPAGAVLTDSGRRLLEPAEQVLAAEARLRRVAAEDGPVAGHVRVGAPDSLCAAVLPTVISALRRDHPAVDVRLTPASTVDAVDGLRSGQLSVAVILATAFNEPDITVTEIGRLPVALLTAPDRLAARGRVGWAYLADEEFYLLEEGCVYCDQFVARLDSMPDAVPRLTRLGSVDAARACCLAGLGLTLLPTVTVGDQLASGQLVRVDGPAIEPVPVLLARHRLRSPGRACEAVMTAITDQCATLSPG